MDPWLLRARRALVAHAGLAILTAGGGGVASADTSLSTAGLTGLHFLNDVSPAQRGVGRLHHASAQWRIVVRPPVIYARDVTHGVDMQRVAWQPVIVRASDGAPIRLGPLTAAEATDAAPGPFAAPSIVLTDRKPADRYLVHVRMLRYTPTGAVEGAALHRADFYGNWAANGFLGVFPAFSHPVA